MCCDVGWCVVLGVWCVSSLSVCCVVAGWFAVVLCVYCVIVFCSEFYEVRLYEVGCGFVVLSSILCLVL